MDNPKELIVNGEIAYKYVENPYYYITKSGILYSTYVKGAHGKYDLSNPRRVVYGQDKDGYYRCVLSFEGKHKYIKIHQIVAIQFLGYKRYETDLVINHIDGNKHNNSVDNLEVVTVKENNRHAWRTGLIDKYKNPTRIYVDIYDNKTGDVFHCSSLEDVVNLNMGISKRHVNYIKNNKINFNLCMFKKVITGPRRLDYKVECYYNGMLFKTFANVSDAGKYFNKPSNSISSAFRSKYPKKVNRYTLTFPNLSTIENIAV